MPHALTRLGPCWIAAVLLSSAVSAGCDWPWRHDMYNQPSPSPSAGPRDPAPGAIPLESRGPYDRLAGESVASPLPARGAGDGRALHDIYCAPCDDGAVGRFFPRMPLLNSADVQRHGDGYLYATITNGTGLMPSYGHVLDPAERWQIVQFLRSMPRQ
ncbi:MAG TPA: cytochrome c [Vicinamibacterales bacterium]|nr:cytochrome c [Vicinamibacterales bacterium]